MKRSTLTYAALGGTLVLGACADRSALLAPADRTSQAVAGTVGGAADIAPAPLGRVIVRFRAASAPGREIAADARRQAAERFAVRHGARLEREMRLPRMWVLETTPGQEGTLAAALQRDPDIEFAEADELIVVEPCETGACAGFNDPLRGFKWDLHNTGTVFNGLGESLGSTGKADADIDWLEAYDALGADFGGEAVIGILDSGILPTHPDLAGKVVRALNFATGYAATLTEDRDGHGTHVAGIAAAAGNNGVGVSGVGYGRNIKLINAKVCERYLFPDGVVRTSCPSSSTADAIVWAADNGAHVLNLSLGGPATATAGALAQQTALQYARSQGVLPFCASGNDGNLTSISFPARFPECVAVGATSWSDERAGYSNASPAVELSAPGGDGNPTGSGWSLIASTSRTGGYVLMAGTSMATPQVAGLAALLYATGLRTPQAVLDRMKGTADDLGAPGMDAAFGAGRINACRALDPAVVAIEAPGSVNLRDGSSAIVPVTLFGGPRFEVSQFDVATVTLGTPSTAGVTVAMRDADYRAAVTDVNGDGIADLTLKFSRTALVEQGGLIQGTRTLALHGSVGCRRVQGTHTVRVTR